MIVKGNKIVKHGFGTVDYDLCFSYNANLYRTINVKYTGYWHDDQMQGKGRYECTQNLNGSNHYIKYEGNFNDNMFEGRGLLLQNTYQNNPFEEVYLTFHQEYFFDKVRRLRSDK